MGAAQAESVTPLTARAGCAHIRWMHAGPGRFITLEGGEGAGKSTQARRLAAVLAAAGLPVLRTREPGGAPGAEAIRGVLLGSGPWDPVAETMLHFAARREHLARMIRPALAAGIWVVCDRFADSTLAYQVAGQGVARSVWDGLAVISLDGLRPDLTLVLDIAPEAGLARAEARGETNRYETLGLAFHGRIRDAFLEIARAEPDRCVLVDALRDADAVFGSMLGVVRDRFGFSDAGPGGAAPWRVGPGRAEPSLVEREAPPRTPGS